MPCSIYNVIVQTKIGFALIVVITNCRPFVDHDVVIFHMKIIRRKKHKSVVVTFPKRDEFVLDVDSCIYRRNDFCIMLSHFCNLPIVHPDTL